MTKDEIRAIEPAPQAAFDQEIKDADELQARANHYEAENGRQAEILNSVIQQRDELLVALEATVEAIRLFRNEPQLERLVSLRATAGYVAMDAAMDRGTDAIDAARGG